LDNYLTKEKNLKTGQAIGGLASGHRNGVKHPKSKARRDPVSAGLREDLQRPGLCKLYAV